MMEKQCMYCGAKANPQDKYCMVCGKPFTEKNIQYAADTKPLTMWEYVLLFLVTAIPVVNIIMLCIWAFRKQENVNRKHFARAALIFVGIGVVATVVMGAIFLQAILYGLAFGIQEWDTNHEYWYDDEHHHVAPSQDGDWLQKQELLDKAFTTSKTDTSIKQIWIQENGFEIL